MFSTAKNNKCFLLSIPAQEKYIPLVRRYIVDALSIYGFRGGFLDQIEIVIDELSNKFSQSSQKCVVDFWLNIKFEVDNKGFSFNILEQGESKNGESIKGNAGKLLSEFPETRLVERYSDSARIDLRGGSIVNVKMSRFVKED